MHVTLHLTTACNLRCDYCYSPPHGGPRMSVETAERALRLGASLSAGSTGVVFFGGEPLLERDRIRQITARARSLEGEGVGRFHFKVTTNGIGLDDEFLRFAERERMLVALSIDGVRDAHDAHRLLPNGRGSFDRVHDALRRLLAVKPYSMVIAVVNPDTAALLPDSVSFLLDEGCRYLIVSPNFDATWEDRDLRVLRRSYRRLARMYVRWTREGRKFYLSPFEVKFASHIQGERFRLDRCELAERQISVAPTGHLFPCVQFPRAGAESPWCIGHVDRGIDEDARRRIRARSDRGSSECADCAIRNRCNHTCGCLNWQATGRVDRVSGVLCRTEKMLVETVDRIGKRLYADRNPLFVQKHYNAAYPVLSVLEDVEP